MYGIQMTRKTKPRRRGMERVERVELRGAGVEQGSSLPKQSKQIRCCLELLYFQSRSALL